jgi:hypothetical protein
VIRLQRYIIPNMESSLFKIYFAENQSVKMLHFDKKMERFVKKNTNE